MNTQLIIGIVIAVVLGAVAVSAGSETCFAKGEQTTGLNKICLYRCVSGDAAITIKSTQLCPLSIKR